MADPSEGRKTNPALSSACSRSVPRSSNTDAARATRRKDLGDFGGPIPLAHAIVADFLRDRRPDHQFAIRPVNVRESDSQDLVPAQAGEGVDRWAWPTGGRTSINRGPLRRTAILIDCEGIQVEIVESRTERARDSISARLVALNRRMGFFGDFKTSEVMQLLHVDRRRSGA